MASNHPVRLRAYSSPSRPRTNPIADRSTTHEHGLGSDPANPHKTVELTPTKKGTPPSPSSPSSPQAGPLRMFRERLRRPSSAGGALSERKDSQERPNVLTRKPPRVKRVKSRPSTSSGVPDRNAPKPSQESLPPRFSMSTARKRRESSVPPLIRSSDFAIPTRDNHHHDGSNIRIGPGLGVHKNKSKVQPLVISNPRPIDAQHLDELEAEANLDEARFSTADRTILNELKFKMQAREAQFKVKNGKRHHPYSPKEVPYPLHYEQSVVDYGIWEVMWMQTVTKDLTWHPLETIPQKVLDLGCGSGHWILECARHWKDTHFVGLDIVPLQPDLYQLGTSQMASRITWVQANFLEPLPFQNEEFDFIYAKRIARGVPEDKWDSLLEELTRILKPGGRFEILEEELCFPGKPVHAQPETLVDLDLSISSPQSSDIWTNDPFGSLDSLSPPTSTSSHRPSAGYPQADWPILKRSSSGTMLGLGNIPPLPLPLSSQPSLSSRAYQKSPLHSVTLPLAAEDDDHTRDLDPEQSSRTRAPINPRDHSLLEFIYNEMHAARFINLEPLALLKNSFPLHFKHTCIHPPVILTFPPRSKSPEDSTGSGAKLHITSLLASPNPHVLIDDDRFNPFFQRAKASTSEDSITSIYEQFWRDEEGGDSPRSEGPGMSSWRHVLREGHSKHCRKPMASINFQLESLNMLLALKVHEVVACAEEMWAWVVHYQKTQPLSPQVNHRGGLWARAKPHQETLVHMSRSEFNDMITRFQLDMQEHIGMGDTVRSRLGWNEPVTARTQARKEFDQLATEWRIHQSLKQHPSPANASTLSTPRLDSASTTDESDGHTRSDHLPNFALPEATFRGSADENADEDLNVPLASLEPWERISRKMCIAIGWKAGRQNGI